MTQTESLERFHTFWPRFWAGWIDALIFLPLGFVNFWMWDHVSTPLILVPWFLFHHLAFAMYSILLHGLFGQTVGKRLTGVKVVDLSETKLSMKQAALRDCVSVLFTVIGLAMDLPTVASGKDPYAFEPYAFEGGSAQAYLGSLGIARLLATGASSLWFLLELITMLTNSKRRALHDFIAGSVVVRVRAESEETVARQPVA